MRKIRLHQSFLIAVPHSDFEVSFSPGLLKNFHDSICRKNTLLSIDAYAACNFSLIHLTIQMPK
jgi:hypothetical protein